MSAMNHAGHGADQDPGGFITWIGKVAGPWCRA
jgi:hypothetical protein